TIVVRSRMSRHVPHHVASNPNLVEPERVPLELHPGRRLLTVVAETVRPLDSLPAPSLSAAFSRCSGQCMVSRCGTLAKPSVSDLCAIKLLRCRRTDARNPAVSVGRIQRPMSLPAGSSPVAPSLERLRKSYHDPCQLPRAVRRVR